MQSGKLITGLAIGAVVALILIPKSRKIISDTFCRLTDSIKDLADNAMAAAETGSDELRKYADKARDVAGAV